MAYFVIARGGYNKEALRKLPEGISLTEGQMNRLHWLGAMVPVDLLALATFPGGMPWFECF